MWYSSKVEIRPEKGGVNLFTSKFGRKLLARIEILLNTRQEEGQDEE